MRKELGIRLHWEEWEWRNELSQNQMELGEMGLVSGGIEMRDNERGKIFNFFKFLFFKIENFYFF